ncbi:hypothetical protein BFV94_1749 [Alteromonas macleodii]|uniref:Uncharacterized protein n=1 Tax=Alteromonas macleodii TaxID=28108 RepID=A0AB36G195_ALTMA|nr:hypothetical protein BFV95_1749 [Alteromonas macleodii]OES34978.1 hypothetical protein BFV94_1749 [Alteromonas macleodii]OES42214.1 hypothetical protein BFV96_1749 [Alteromonas macleodii]
MGSSRQNVLPQHCLLLNFVLFLLIQCLLRTFLVRINFNKKQKNSINVVFLHFI